MKRLSTLCLTLALALSATPLLAAGNAEQGRTKALFCTVCHGLDGKNEIPMLMGGTARLAGMDAGKFVAAMKAYRYGQRFHPLMQILVIPMAEQDFEDFAAYYASLGAKP